MPKAIPTVRGSRLSGSARDLREDQLGTYEQAMHDHGDIAHFRIGPPRVGFGFDAVFHPDGARDILTSRSYRKDAPVFTEFARMFGYGLATLEGERWRAHRRMLQPLFTRRRVADYLPVIARASDDLVDSWEPHAEAGETVDLLEGAMRYTLGALGRALFGGDLQAVAPTLRASVPVLNSHATRRGLAPVRVPASWPTPANRRAERARQAIHGLIDDLIRHRRSEPADDLLSLLLTAHDPETGDRLDDDEIRDEALIFFIAGYEATATALAFSLYLLGRHDAAQERVRAEADRCLGDPGSTEVDLDGLAYTTQVVHEALRLYPPVHTLVRRAVDGGEVLGHVLPRGRIVAVNIWSIHRNPAIWPDPQRFDPDRFDPSREAELDRYAHLPFGGGPRTCIGAHLAMADIVTAVAEVVRAFRLRSVDESPALNQGITLSPRGELSCRLERVGRQTPDG